MEAKGLERKLEGMGDLEARIKKLLTRVMALKPTLSGGILALYHVKFFWELLLLRIIIAK